MGTIEKQFRTYGFFVYDDVLPVVNSMNVNGSVDTDAVSRYVAMRKACLNRMQSDGAIASAFSCGSDSDGSD